MVDYFNTIPIYYRTFIVLYKGIYSINVYTKVLPKLSTSETMVVTQKDDGYKVTCHYKMVNTCPF